MNGIPVIRWLLLLTLLLCLAGHVLAGEAAAWNYFRGPHAGVSPWATGADGLGWQTRHRHPLEDAPGHAGYQFPGRLARPRVSH